MSFKSWFKISISALLLTAGLFFTGCEYLQATFDRKGYLEKQSAPLVTKILHRADIKLDCLSVKITKNIGSKKYKAKATLDNGKELDIKIEDRGEQIYVEADNTSNSTLELWSVPLVSQILKENLGDEAAACLNVKIDYKTGSNYKAKAELDNGNEIDITIEPRGDTVYVEISPL